MFKMLKRFFFFRLRVTAGFVVRVYFHGIFSDAENHSLPQKVDELAERQYTASKEQAHVATKLTCWKNFLNVIAA